MDALSAYGERLRHLGSEEDDPPARVRARVAFVRELMTTLRTDASSAAGLLAQARAALEAGAPPPEAAPSAREAYVFEAGSLDALATAVRVDPVHELSPEVRGLARNATAMRLLEVGAREADRHQAQVAEELGIDEAAVSHLVALCARHGLVFAVKHGRRNVLRTTSAGRVLLQRVRDGIVEGFDPTALSSAPGAHAGSPTRPDPAHSTDELEARLTLRLLEVMDERMALLVDRVVEAVKSSERQPARPRTATPTVGPEPVRVWTKEISAKGTGHASLSEEALVAERIPALNRGPKRSRQKG